MTGKIVRLVADKGFGFIQGEDGHDYFFHHSAIFGAGIEDLRQGDGVTFEVEEAAKGPRATNVTRTST